MTFVELRIRQNGEAALHGLPDRKANHRPIETASMRVHIYSMKTNLILCSIVTLSLAAGLSRSASATEPERIYDLESDGFIANPNYHEPAIPASRANRTKPPTVPRRIYDLESRQFIINPDYHEPPPLIVPNAHASEPRRIYNAETGQYEINPAYRETVKVAPEPVLVHAHHRVASHKQESTPSGRIHS
jgi:hypothetical protein